MSFMQRRSFQPFVQEVNWSSANSTYQVQNPVNIVQAISTTTTALALGLGFWRYNASDFNAGWSAYLEVVGGNGAAGTATFQLYDYTASATVSGTLTTTNVGYTTLRSNTAITSADLIDGHVYGISFFSSISTDTVSIVAGRLIFLETGNGTPAKRTSFIQNGYSTGGIVSTSFVDIDGSLRFLWESAKWNGSPYVYLEVTQNNNSATTGRTSTRLYDYTAGAAVANSTVTGTAGGSVYQTIRGNSALSLIDGHEYGIQSSVNSGSGTLLSSQLVIAQTNPTMWQIYRPTGNATWTTTGAAEATASQHWYYKPSEFLRTNVSWNYEASLKVASAGPTAYSRAYITGTGVLGNEVSTTSTAWSRARTTSSLAMPVANSFMQQTLHNSDGVTSISARSTQYIGDVTLTGYVPPNVLLNTADGYSYTTSTPALEFTGTDPDDNEIRYEIQIGTDPYFTGGYAAYNEAGKNALPSILMNASGNNSPYGQAFIATASGTLDTVDFWADKVGAPSGNMTVTVYDVTGIVGSTAVPAGAAIATSDAVAANSLTTVGAFKSFPFSGANRITLTAGSSYIVAMNYTGGDASNYINIDFGTATFGNRAIFSSSAWGAFTGFPLIMHVNVVGAALSADKVSGTDTGFLNTVVGGDTDPFTSGQKISYTAQSALSNGTYYWRVRGKDPLGTNSYGSWSPVRSFAVAVVSAASISTITDDFNSGTFSAVWTNTVSDSPASVTNTNSRIEIVGQTTAYYNQLSTVSSYDFTSAGASIQIVDPGDQTIVSHEAGISIVSSLNSSNKAWVFIGANLIKVYKFVSGSQTQVGTNLAYNSAVHKYLRIRESAGTLYFDYSTDGTTWTNIQSLVNPFGTNVFFANIYLSQWQAQVSGSYGYFDNFNLVASGVTTGYKKVLIGGTWTPKPVKYLVSGTWTVKKQKIYNGSAWVESVNT